MADSKITQLNEMTVPASTDELVIVDISNSNAVNKVTYNNLINSYVGVPYAKITRNSPQPIPGDNTGTAVIFDTSVEDTDGIIDLTSGTTTAFVCQTPGKYLICGQVHFATANTANYYRLLYLTVDNTIISSIQNTTRVSNINKLCITEIYDLSAGEQVEMWVQQDWNGGNLNIVSGTPGIFLSMVKVG